MYKTYTYTCVHFYSVSAHVPLLHKHLFSWPYVDVDTEPQHWEPENLEVYWIFCDQEKLPLAARSQSLRKYVKNSFKKSQSHHQHQTKKTYETPSNKLFVAVSLLWEPTVPNKSLTNSTFIRSISVEISGPI